MAEEPHNTSDISEHVETTPAKEDAETTAARRELKQTSISEKAEQDKAGPLSPDADRSESDEDAAPKDKPVANPARTATPDTDPGDVKSGDDSLLREQVSSPKKKRAHDELVADGSSTAGEGSGKRAHDTADAQSRTEESEPEKKRPRDRDSAKRRRSQDDADSGGSSRSSIDRTRDTKDTSTKTSTSAFASSAFAKLASSSTSPFGALGSAGKPSLFGGSGASGSFSVLGGSKPAAPAATAPKLSFASGTASAPSPFAINGGSGKSVFGSSFASPFGGSAFGGGSLSGPRLSSFAKPGDAVKSEKPARPFGAPESDAEEGSEKGEDGGEDAASDKEDKGADKEKEESKAAEEKKRLRLQKVVVDDGESGEVTLLAVRAKMYVMEKSVGWKERGAGMLKVNVPKSTIEFDEYGNPDPTTFDASVLDEETNEDGSARSVRLIMRQDHTLRVILNTAVLPGMKFQLNQKLKAAFVLFTTFDGEAKQVQMKLSEANATVFTQLMELLQKQLADV